MNIDKLIQTMSNWFITASRLWLEPLCEKLKVQLLKESILYADETTLKVLRKKINRRPVRATYGYTEQADVPKNRLYFMIINQICGIVRHWMFCYRGTHRIVAELRLHLKTHKFTATVV